jgi:hypothetical protein
VEILRLDEAFVKILGVKPKFLRYVPLYSGDLFLDPLASMFLLNGNTDHRNMINSPPYGSIDDRTASYIQQTHGKTIVLWSEDSGDSTGGTAQQSYNFYQGLANENPKRPHMTLSHETEPAGTDALHMGTVPLLANAGIQLQTVAQCLDTDPYEQVGGYGTRDSTWYCGGTWTPPSSGGGGGGGSGTCVTTYTSVSGDTCTSIGSSVSGIHRHLLTPS